MARLAFASLRLEGGHVRGVDHVPAEVGHGAAGDAHLGGGGEAQRHHVHSHHAGPDLPEKGHLPGQSLLARRGAGAGQGVVPAERCGRVHGERVRLEAAAVQGASVKVEVELSRRERASEEQGGRWGRRDEVHDVAPGEEGADPLAHPHHVAQAVPADVDHHDDAGTPQGRHSGGLWICLNLCILGLTSAKRYESH